MKIEVINMLHNEAREMMIKAYEKKRTKVIKMGYTYKKKSLHASERERSRCKGTKKKMD